MSRLLRFYSQRLSAGAGEMLATLSPHRDDCASSELPRRASARATHVRVSVSSTRTRMKRSRADRCGARSRCVLPTAPSWPADLPQGPFGIELQADVASVVVPLWRAGRGGQCLRRLRDCLLQRSGPLRLPRRHGTARIRHRRTRRADRARARRPLRRHRHQRRARSPGTPATCGKWGSAIASPASVPWRCWLPRPRAGARRSSA